MPQSRRLLPVLALLLVGAALALTVWLARPRWSVEGVRDAVVTTIQSEAPASDLVTGRVGIAARREIRNLGQFSWLPAWLDLPGVNVLDAEARVEATGEALYGFDVRALTPDMIEVYPSGLVEVTLPPLRVVAVDTDLAGLRVESEEGVLRGGAGRQLEAEALRDVEALLLRQAEQHLADSVQPAVNTSKALEAMLRPPLRAAGLEAPRFRFRLGPDLTLEPSLE
ncbi:MAG: DUF4230 domain-containing protein [Bacteroidota bacterium]